MGRVAASPDKDQMLIHINGWPGVGKLTVARLLSDQLRARLLHNHSFYNVAFALTEFRSADFYRVVRAVRSVAFDRVAEMDPHTPVIITNALTECEWGWENWEAVQQLADQRGSSLMAVTLDCSAAENIRRLRSDERVHLGKLTDPTGLISLRADRPLLDCGSDAVRVDTTALRPDEVAAHILRSVSYQ